MSHQHDRETLPPEPTPKTATEKWADALAILGVIVSVAIMFVGSCSITRNPSAPRPPEPPLPIIGRQVGAPR